MNRFTMGFRQLNYEPVHKSFSFCLKFSFVNRFTRFVECGPVHNYIPNENCLYFQSYYDGEYTSYFSIVMTWERMLEAGRGAGGTWGVGVVELPSRRAGTEG